MKKATQQVRQRQGWRERPLACRVLGCRRACASSPRARTSQNGVPLRSPFCGCPRATGALSALSSGMPRVSKALGTRELDG